MLITPEYVFKDVTHITPEWLAQKGKMCIRDSGCPLPGLSVN